MKPIGGATGLALSAIYGAGIRLRHALYDRGILPVRTLPVPVWSIGNLTVGGTGKTPVTAFLAAELRALGARPAILSRGYGRRSEKSRVVVPTDEEPAGLDAALYGDEPILLRRRLPDTPIVLAADRFEAGDYACRAFDPDIILLDDGLQHRRLARTRELIVLDGSEPFGNGRLIPAGTLREQPGRGLVADWHLVNETAGRSPACAKTLDAACFGSPRALFRYVAGRVILPDGGEEDPLQWGTRPIWACSGIGNPDSFLSLLGRSGFRVAGHRGFRDHHRFTRRELTALASDARAAGSAIVTTEKDWLRIPDEARRRFAVHALSVELEWTGGEDAFRAWIAGALKGDRFGGSS
ncbi:MAG: tetraacyldisaccharide 4'-kinase [Gemmatimonadetes bacterium]|nr:tetraacyldisaccharide 4'-kinase [Gemmatimonadota bacterium]